MLPDELWRPEQVLVGGQRTGSAAGAGGGLGEYRPARLPGQVNQGQRVVVAVAADHHAAFGPRQLERIARRVLVRETGPRLSPGAPVERFWPPLVATGYQRLAEGQVEADRARTLTQAAHRARRLRPGLAGQRAPVADRARPGLGQAASQNQRTALPYNLIWSMAWLAPIPRSSGGRSAVSRMQRHG